jgi:hypothetical protein
VDGLKEIGIPELSEDQMQTLSEIAEQTARDHVLSRVPQKRISTLNIVVETTGSKPVTIAIDVDLALSQQMKTLDPEKLAREATQKALEAVEQHLRGLSCRSKT